MFRALKDANPDVPEKEFNDIWTKVEQKVRDEPPPKIAIIGQSGVGKSSTLNALFNAGQGISHTEAYTQIESELKITIDTVSGEKGTIIVYDMPGLGESMISQQRHLATYERVLQKVDVVLWILEAHYRGSIGGVQKTIDQDLKHINPELINKMVFAANKVDLVSPGETAWNTLVNLPSEEQERNIKSRLRDIDKKMKESLPYWNGTVIGYSAEKRYNLPQLFASMLDGVSETRQWVLTSRKSLADFLELVDPDFLPEEQRLQRSINIKKRVEKQNDKAEEAIKSMSEEEFAQLSKSKDDLIAWFRKLRD